jgi:hypothetical protein
MGKLLATPAWSEGDRPSPEAPIMAPPSRPGARVTSPTGLELRPQPGSLVPPGRITNLVLEGVFSKLQGNLDNTSNVPLETDILRTEKKRELLYLILRQWEDALEELRRSQVQAGQLTERSPLMLQRVWSNSLTTFFGPYYTLPVDNLEQPVVETLMAEGEEVGQ